MELTAVQLGRKLHCRQFHWHIAQGFNLGAMRFFERTVSGMDGHDVQLVPIAKKDLGFWGVEPSKKSSSPFFLNALKGG